MARRANATLIGLFIVGAIVLAVSATLLFSSGLFQDKSRFVMFFSGSVKGLSVGAPVNFRGVKIGTVTGIRLLLDPDTRRVYIPVYVELESEQISLISGESMAARKMNQMGDLIANGLHAQLQMQNLLTGQLAIQLDIDPNIPANRVGIEEGVVEIPTSLEEFPVDTLLNNIASAAAGIDKVFNGPELQQAIRQFDDTMKEFSTLPGEYTTLAQRLDQRSGELSTGLNATLEEIRSTLQMSHELISSGKTLFSDSSDLVKQLRFNADRITSRTEATLTAIKSASDSANELIAEGSPFQYQLTQTLEEIARSARALRGLANTLEQNPEALIRGRADEEER